MTLAEMEHGTTLEGVRSVYWINRVADSATTSPRRVHAIRVASGATPIWWAAAVERLRELVALQHDWDTYGAPPLDRGVVDLAVGLLWSAGRDIASPPWIVPTSLGGLQIEWHENDLDVEITLAPGQSVSLYVEDAHGEDEEPFSSSSELWARVRSRL